MSIRNVVSFLLGKSPASVYSCMPTSRNSLSVPSSKAMVPGIFTGDKVDRCERLTTLPPSIFKCREILEALSSWNPEGFSRSITLVHNSRRKEERKFLFAPVQIVLEIRARDPHS